MKQEQIKEIEQILGYEFKNKQFLIQAYTRRSFTEENPGTDNNEILEMIGDAVINQQVTLALYEKHRSNLANINEGILTAMRQEIVCGKNLAKHAVRLGLVKQDCFRLGKGDRLNRVYEQESVREDLLESIVGAVAIDLQNYVGFNYPVRILMTLVVRLLDLKNLDIFRPYIYYPKQAFEHSSNIGKDNHNPINYLQELWRAKRIPAYTYKDEGGFEGNWTYSISMPEKGLHFTATERTKKKASMSVAKKLYEEIVKIINKKEDTAHE